jgi:hypothetical protein
MKCGRLLLIAVAVAATFAGCDGGVMDQIRRDVAAAGPDISLKIGDTSYLSGSTITLGWATPNDTTTYTINIRNTGSQPLVLTVPVPCVNTLGSAFAISQQPQSTIQPGADSSLVILFHPLTAGAYAASVSVTSNDSQTPLFSVVVQANCYPPGNVTSPSTGNAFLPNTVCTVTWAAFSGGTHVKIELLKGSTLDSTICATTTDSGSFAWTIPGGQNAGNDYQVRVTSLEVGNSGTSGTFAIGTISGVDPNGSEKLKPGENPTITWSSALGGNVKIELWKGGSFNSTIAASQSNSGSYTGWTVPALSGSDFRIRVVSVANAAIFDESDANFSIGTISAVAPTGGALFPGSSTTITWTSAIGGTVKLELLKDAVVQGSPIALSAPNTGSYAGWTVPVSGSGTGYKIRVTSTDNPAIFDESVASFSIGKITVTAMNGGEAYDQGATATISWTSDLGGTVKIQLLKDGSLYGGDIVSSKSNTTPFTHSWTISTNQKPTTHYRIRISSNLNSTIYDDSDADFKVRGWDSYAENAGSPGTSTEIDFAMGSDSKPVIAYIDASNNAIAEKWSGTGWTSYGAANSNPLYNNTSGWDGTLAIGLSSSNNVYLAYVSDAAAESYRVHLKYSSGSGWTDYGYGTTGAAYCLAMTMDIVSSPYIAFYDTADTPNFRARAIRRYSGTWEDKGFINTKYGMPMSICLGNYWNPIVGYMAYDTGAWTVNVKCWLSGTTWTDYGAVSGAGGGTYISVANQVSLALPSPYAVFMEGTGTSGTIRVKKYVSGTTWTDLGSVGTGTWTAIALDPTDNKPFVVFRDLSAGGGGKATLVKYVSGTTWTALGSYEASLGYGAFNVKVAVDPSDKMPVIAFFDAAGYVRVVKRVY